MRVLIVAVGRMKQGPERELADRYLGRAASVGRPLQLTGFETVELPESRASSSEARKTEEARAIAAALPDNAVRVVLDERGKPLTSEQFAGTIVRWRDDGKTAMAFIIGGADGLAPDLRKSADAVIAFSPLTWPHQLVRVMLAEQLYRTTTILSGHPYHRGD